MPEFTPQQMAFADYLYDLLSAGRKSNDSLLILVVGENNQVIKVIEEKRAVAIALTLLRGPEPTLI